MTLQERLNKIIQENNKKKDAKSRLEGQLETLRKQAFDQFGCDTVEGLQKKLDELEPQLMQQEKELNERLQQMEAYANN